MQRLLSFLVIVCCVVTLSRKVSTNKVIDHNLGEIEQKKLNPDRRNLPVFPKKTMKFVVTPIPFRKTVYSHKPKQKIMPKIPLIPQVTLRSKLETSATTTTRKPLLNLRPFTIKSNINEKFNEIQNKDRNYLHNVNKSENLTGIKVMGLTKSRKQSVTEVYATEESKNLIRFNEIDDKTPHNQVKGLENNNDKFLFGEEQDLSELIFLEESKNRKRVVHTDNLDNIDQEYDEYAGTTINYKMIDEPERVRRSQNIIEEENIASTVSVLKFTGRDTRLDNNFYFRNINS